MRFLKSVLVVASAVILAAHFLRSGNLVLMCGYLLLPALLLLRRTWVIRWVQVLLVFGAVEWGRATMGYVRERQALGQPWERLALILGLVILLTLVSAFVLQPPRLSQMAGRS